MPKRKIAVKTKGKVAQKRLPGEEIKPKAVPEKKSKLNELEWLKGEGMTLAKMLLSVQTSDCNNLKLLAELRKFYTKVNFYTGRRLLLFLTNIFSLLDGTLCIHGSVSEDD